MRRLIILIFLPILSVSTVRSNTVIKQVKNNEEVPVETLNISALMGERVELHCYVNLTLGNGSYLRDGLGWETPRFQFNKPSNKNGSVLIIPRMSWSDQGFYTCWYAWPLRQTLYVSVNSTAWFNQDSFFKDNKENVSNNSHTYKRPIFFIPAVIVIILCLVAMCYYFRSLINTSWKRLPAVNCRHQLYIHRCRVDPMEACLLQSTRTSASSIVIVDPSVNEHAIDNVVRESDRPPSYNDVIPQEVPPTYYEAIETAKKVFSNENQNDGKM